MNAHAASVARGILILVGYLLANLALELLVVKEIGEGLVFGLFFILPWISQEDIGFYVWYFWPFWCALFLPLAQLLAMPFLLRTGDGMAWQRSLIAPSIGGGMMACALAGGASTVISLSLPRPFEHAASWSVPSLSLLTLGTWIAVCLRKARNVEASRIHLRQCRLLYWASALNLLAAAILYFLSARDGAGEFVALFLLSCTLPALFFAL